jgi:hypothetical protein
MKTVTKRTMKMFRKTFKKADTDNTDTDGKRCPAFLDGDEEDPESSQNYSKKTYFDNRKRKKCPYCGTNMNQLSYAVSYSML